MGIHSLVVQDFRAA